MVRRFVDFVAWNMAQSLAKSDCDCARGGGTRNWGDTLGIGTFFESFHRNLGVVNRWTLGEEFVSTQFRDHLLGPPSKLLYSCALRGLPPRVCTHPSVPQPPCSQRGPHRAHLVSSPTFSFPP